MENHGIVGGVGSATAVALAETGTPAKLVRLGLQGVYAHGASREYLCPSMALMRMLLCVPLKNMSVKS